MSGYFSQLARSTGLSIGRSRNGAMRGLPVAPVAAPARDTALEVEEVVLVAPQQTDSSSELKLSDRSAASIEIEQGVVSLHVSDDSTPRSEADSAIRATDFARTNSGPEPAVDHKAPQDSQSEQSNVNADPQFAGSLKIATTPTFLLEPEIDSRGPHDQLLPEPREASISIEPVERIELVTREVNNAVTQPPNLSERTDLVALDMNVSARSDSPALPLERARVARNQLKEVIAWVTANPNNLEEEPLPEILISSRSVSGRDPADHSQLDSLSPQPARAHAPEIQDFSLSIGNISIVIDEPKQDAPTLPTPPPIIERPPEIANRPTDLSRYYLD